MPDPDDPKRPLAILPDGAVPGVTSRQFMSEAANSVSTSSQGEAIIRDAGAGESNAAKIRGVTSQVIKSGLRATVGDLPRLIYDATGEEDFTTSQYMEVKGMFESLSEEDLNKLNPNDRSIVDAVIQTTTEEFLDAMTGKINLVVNEYKRVGDYVDVTDDGGSVYRVAVARTASQLEKDALELKLAEDALQGDGVLSKEMGKSRPTLDEIVDHLRAKDAEAVNIEAPSSVEGEVVEPGIVEPGTPVGSGASLQKVGQVAYNAAELIGGLTTATASLVTLDVGGDKLKATSQVLSATIAVGNLALPAIDAGVAVVDALDAEALSAYGAEIEGWLANAGELANQGVESIENVGRNVLETFSDAPDVLDKIVSGEYEWDDIEKSVAEFSTSGLTGAGIRVGVVIALQQPEVQKALARTLQVISILQKIQQVIKLGKVIQVKLKAQSLIS